MMRTRISVFFVFALILILQSFKHDVAAQNSPSGDSPLRVGIVGLTHTHVHWLLGRPDRGDIAIVGIVEPNKELAKRYSQQHGFSMGIVFNTMDEMIEKTKPEAVTAFGSIFEHLAVVEKCAPLGIHVMVEKPLAVNYAHAEKMKGLADKYHIFLLTNYETSWYASNHRAFSMINDERKIGDIRKIFVHDGHKGPMEIGVNSEFLDWLTDPKANGGGALTDFGCYGANLITWLLKGEKPVAVIAVTQQIKPDIYPNVDDEATIILEYSNRTGIIQASWNWPFNRKDMEIYGQTGYIFSENKSDLRIKLKEDEPEFKEKLADRLAPYDDPFSFLAAVIKGKIEIPPYDLSSLENNMIVTEILDAAMKSAVSGKKQFLKK